MSGEKALTIGTADLAWLDQALGVQDFFSAWTPENAKELLPSFSLRAYPAGSRLIEEGAQGGDMFILYKGSLRVLRKRMIFGQKEVARLQPGDFFGEVGFLVGAPRSATIEAAEPSQVFLWSANDMQRVLRMNDEIARKLEETARQRIARLSGQK